MKYKHSIIGNVIFAGARDLYHVSLQKLHRFQDILAIKYRLFMCGTTRSRYALYTENNLSGIITARNSLPAH